MPMASPLRVNTAELLRRPGTEKSIDAVVTPDDLQLHDDRFDPSGPVRIGLHLESLTDGVVVRGSVEVDWSGTCRRCATPVAGHLVCEVDELYQEVVTDAEAFELVGEQLDLVPMVREIVVLDAPLSPLCRPDCAGLCPHCGIDRNAEKCECVPVESDHRWAALEEFKQSFES
ncbi:MAG: hypothetical protein RLZZ623_2553 [Actinomycetota bacterium]|jgi:uncharacterized protein